MKRLFFVSFAVFFILFALAAGAQGKLLSLSQTANKQQTDGVIGAKEYSVSTDFPKMKLALSWVADTLFIGVSAETTGWVAVGLGSPKMDNSIIYIGYATGDKAQLKVQKGVAHGHGDVDSNSPIAYALKETGGRTTLELAVKAASFIAKSQKQLDVIVAFGSSDSFSSMHQARYPVTVQLAQ
jgi:hypothetical protein